MKLPDIEAVSAAVHAAWMASKREQGVTTRQAEDGEELMVPYVALSEKAKDLDRNSVRAVYAAIDQVKTQSDPVLFPMERSTADALVRIIQKIDEQITAEI
jgi:hypothetical protein